MAWRRGERRAAAESGVPATPHPCGRAQRVHSHPRVPPARKQAAPLHRCTAALLHSAECLRGARAPPRALTTINSAPLDRRRTGWRWVGPLDGSSCRVGSLLDKTRQLPAHVRRTGRQRRVIATAGRADRTRTVGRLVGRRLLHLVHAHFCAERSDRLERGGEDRCLLRCDGADRPSFHRHDRRNDRRHGPTSA